MPNVLLTNDDGIDAPGIRALFESVTHAFRTHRPQDSVRILVVAPDRCRSECGHSIETSRPLRFATVRDDWHSVDGTPVDCIRVAHYAMDFRPDLVFSGINAGANLGVNLMVSGTFAAAREASLLGIPAMAASHYRHPDIPKTWDHTPAWLCETIGQFLETNLGGDSDDGEHDAGELMPTRQKSRGPTPLWNVNLPAIAPQPNHIPERVHCLVDRCPIDRAGRIQSDGRVDFDLDFHARPRESGRDVEQCFDGRITISKLDVHLGHHDAMHAEET